MILVICIYLSYDSFAVMLNSLVLLHVWEKGEKCSEIQEVIFSLITETAR